MSISRRTVLQTAVSLAAPAIISSSWAQDKFPSKPITLIAPWPAGGSSDAGDARLWRKRWLVRLGGNVIVENKPGVGGSLGATAMVTPSPMATP